MAANTYFADLVTKKKSLRFSIIFSYFEFKETNGDVP